MIDYDKLDHFALAVQYARANNDQKWDIAKEIQLAVEDGFSVREIALAADGSYDKVMTYTNYQSAHIMREVVRTVNSERLLPLYNLPISYWWTAYGYLMKNVDIEYIIDTLFDTILEDNKLRGQRWLKSKLAEFANEGEDLTQVVRTMRKWLARYTNAMYSVTDSMNEKIANAASQIIENLTEVEVLLYVLDPGEEL